MNGTFQAMRRMFTSGDRRRLRDLCREERGSLPWTHGGVHEARAVRMRAWEAARDAYDAVWAEHAEFQGLPRVCPPGDDMTDEEHAEFGSRPWRL